MFFNTELAIYLCLLLLSEKPGVRATVDGDISLQKMTAKEWLLVLAAYRQADAQRSIREIAVTLVPFILLWALAWASLDGPRIITLMLAIGIGFLLMRVFCLQHDCGHYSLFASRHVCDWLGRALGVLTITPYHTWRVMHGAHHANAGNLDAPELGEVRTITVKEFQRRGFLGQMAYRFYRHPVFLLGIAPFLLFFGNSQAPPTFECYCQFYGESNLPFCACFFLSCLNSVAPG